MTLLTVQGVSAPQALLWLDIPSFIKSKKVNNDFHVLKSMIITSPLGFPSLAPATHGELLSCDFREHQPLRSMRERIPCWPVNNSLIKPRSMIHTIADMSTPKAGGINARAGSNKGSVGQTAMTYGNFLMSVFGYHDSTVRTMKRKLNKSTKMSSVGRTMERKFISIVAADAMIG